MHRIKSYVSSLNPVRIIRHFYITFYNVQIESGYLMFVVCFSKEAPPQLYVSGLTSAKAKQSSD